MSQIHLDAEAEEILGTCKSKILAESPGTKLTSLIAFKKIGKKFIGDSNE